MSGFSMTRGSWRNARSTWSDAAHLRNLPGVKGVDWFSWKPFVILDALNRCGPDDIVFYTDADTYPIADLTPAFNIVERDGHMVFRCCAQYHKWWTSSACLQLCGIPVKKGIPLEKEKYFGTDEKPRVARLRPVHGLQADG